MELLRSGGFVNGGERSDRCVVIRLLLYVEERVTSAMFWVQIIKHVVLLATPLYSIYDVRAELLLTTIETWL